MRVRSEKVVTNEKYLDINWYPLTVRTGDVVTVGSETIDMPFGIYKTRRKFCNAFNKMYAGRYTATETDNPGSLLIRKVTDEK